MQHQHPLQETRKFTAAAGFLDGILAGVSVSAEIVSRRIIAQSFSVLTLRVALHRRSVTRRKFAVARTIFRTNHCASTVPKNRPRIRHRRHTLTGKTYRSVMFMLPRVPARISCILYLLLGVASSFLPGVAFPQPISSDEHSFRIVTLVTGLEHPWGLAFLPDGRMLVTERPGRLRIIDKGGKLEPRPVAGLPPVAASGQGGLLDVAAASPPRGQQSRLPLIRGARPGRHRYRSSARAPRGRTASRTYRSYSACSRSRAAAGTSDRGCCSIARAICSLRSATAAIRSARNARTITRAR